MADRRRPGEGSSEGGLGGLFRGLGGFSELVQNLADLAQKAQEAQGEVSRGGEVGDDKGLRAVYGFSLRVGGGGKPHVEQFGNGNVKKGSKEPQIKEVREPMVDLFEEEGEVLLVAELPGVEAGDVRFEVQGEALTLSAARGERKYRKEVALPCAVDGKEALSSFRNGIFELRLRRLRAP